jgi:hypothetical protein
VTIEAKLAQLAEKIADESLLPGVELAERLDAFKQLTAYYVATAKVGKPENHDESGGSDFGSFQSRIAASSGRA